MNIAWYVNRLARMQPSEIAHRVAEQGRRRLSQRSSYGWTRFASEGDLPVLASMKQALLNTASEPLKTAVRNAADRLLAGQFATLGVAWPQRDPDNLFPEDLWRLDPVSGGLWPGAERFCFDIGYRHERELGDVKYVWELNRLQILQPLAAAYALFSDQTALAAVDTALASWIAANPPFQGLGWNSGIELAMRAVSILVATSLCGDALRPETRRMIRPVLRAHLYWINRYPSRFSSSNNHLVAELMGEFLIATSLNDAASPAMIERSRRLLLREANLQLLVDGTPAEQSPTYGAFTAEMLLLCAVTARAVGRPLDSGIDDRLARFIPFVEALADGTGSVPAIGDDDEGRVITLCDPETTYPTSVAIGIAGYHSMSTSLPDIAPQLRNAVFPRPTFTPKPAVGLSTFPNGGYTVVRDRIAGHHLHLVIDHGPLGYLSIAAHGHADANAIILSVDEQPVFVDPGTYLYHSGGEWRDWFRGTLAHNTLTVQDTDQSQILGSFNWGRRAKAALIEVKAGPDWSLTATHDGYKRQFGTDHRRSLVRSSDGFVLLDQLVPPASGHLVKLVFQLAPDVQIRPEDGAYRLNRDMTPVLDLIFESPGDVTLASGEPNEGGGWVSPNFGLKIAAPRLVWSGLMPSSGLRTTIRLRP